MPDTLKNTSTLHKEQENNRAETKTYKMSNNSTNKDISKHLAHIARSKSSIEKYRLPKKLEQNFNYFFEAIILKSIPSFVIVGLTGLFIFSLFIIGFNQSTDITLWLIGLPLIGLCIALNALNLLPQLKPYCQISIMSTGFFSVFISHLLIFFIDESQLLFSLHFMIITTTVVYMSSLSRLNYAILAVLPSILLAVLIALVNDVFSQWAEFLFVSCTINAIGIFFCWTNEIKLRTAFLQQQLVKNEKNQLQKMSIKLKSLARTDELTKIANRRHFMEELNKEWGKHQRNTLPISILYMDIDYFKNYNDHHGHNKGDECLTAIADIIKNSAKRPGDLASRFGGEEFVIMLADTNKQGAIIVAQNILDQITHANIPHNASPIATHVTASIGVHTFIPHPKTTPKTVIKNADHCLYNAKNTGRNRWSDVQSKNYKST